MSKQALTTKKRQAKTLELVPASGSLPAPPSRQKRIRLTTIDDVAAELRRVYKAVRCGEVAPEDGTKLANVLYHLRGAIEESAVEQRLIEVEKALRIEHQPKPSRRDDDREVIDITPTDR